MRFVILVSEVSISFLHEFEFIWEAILLFFKCFIQCILFVTFAQWSELAELVFRDCPNKKTAGLAANLRQELEKAWLAKSGDNSQASCSDVTLGRLIKNISLVRLLTHTIHVWYIYLHLVDFLWYINVGKYINPMDPMGYDVVKIRSSRLRLFPEVKCSRSSQKSPWPRGTRCWSNVLTPKVMSKQRWWKILVMLSLYQLYRVCRWEMKILEVGEGFDWHISIEETKDVELWWICQEVQLFKWFGWRQNETNQIVVIYSKWIYNIIEYRWVNFILEELRLGDHCKKPCWPCNWWSLCFVDFLNSYRIVIGTPQHLWGEPCFLLWFSHFFGGQAYKREIWISSLPQHETDETFAGHNWLHL